MSKMSIVSPSAAVTALSELSIDVEKDWDAKRITNLGAPTASSDAARKDEVDTVQTNLSTHTALTVGVHNFDASGDAPPQSHNNTKHSETYITSTNTGFFRQFWQKQGTVVQGTWQWGANANQTDYASVTGEGAGYWYNSTNTNLDEYKWANIFLPAGNYKIILTSVKDVNTAILEILFGTTSIGTQDLYAAALAYNQVVTITFTITTPTTADLRLRANGRNASSSGYYVYFSRLHLEKTG